ncbi:MAG: glycosyltransferase [Thermoplasmatales archaeon]
MVSVIFAHSRFYSGTENYSLRLLKGLRSLNTEVNEIKINKHEFALLGKPVGGTISQLISARIKNPKDDIVHSTSPNVFNGKTNVITVHDLIPLQMKSVYSTSFYRRLGYYIIFKNIKQVSEIIVFTNSLKEYMCETFRISPDNINVVPQSIDHEIFYPVKKRSSNDTDRKLISMVGDFNPRKRFDLLISAVGGMSDISLVLAGPTNSWVERFRSIESLASKFDNVEIAGQLSPEDLRSLLSNSDLVVYLSESEGFGSLPIESMACGANVLVNDLPIFKETLNDKAFYCSLTVDSVRENIYLALNHRRNSSELIEYSRHFSIENMAKKTLMVYDKVKV